MSIVAVSSLDWPHDYHELNTVSVQCAGESFLDYQSRRLQHRGFHHGSSFNEEDESDEEEEEDISTSTRDLFKMQHAELEALTYYQVLGDIAMHSSKEQVKRAYHKACLRYHPDKTGRGEEDEVFLKVKSAFDTLSDVSKRKAYDSTIDFDDSIPRGGEASHEFYTVYGPVFERNLRFDASKDPERSNKKQNNKKLHSKTRKPPPLGDDDTPLQQVHAFYDYWIHFDSWRDFSLAAQQQTEGNLDVDNAESRYEKRWIMKEIDKKTRALKKEEMARINSLVERAMAADPRLKRERQREKDEKERLAKEKQKRLEQERIEKEKEAARLAKIQAQQEEEERKEKAAAKASKEKEKKQLRKARQLLRKHTMDAFTNANGKKKVYTSLEDMHDDVELLCKNLSAVQITELTNAFDSNTNVKTLRKVHERAVQTKEGLAQESKNAKQRRDKARKAAAAKEEKAKAARATHPWTTEELSALAKAVKKYPAGGANRWETIALFVNNICKPQIPRTKEECIEKFNQIANQKPTSRQQPVKAAPADVKKSVSTPTAAWSEEQDKQLQEGLAKYPASMDKNERWTLIAKCVDGKGKKECVQRFKAIREAIRKK